MDEWMNGCLVGWWISDERTVPGCCRGGQRCRCSDVGVQLVTMGLLARVLVGRVVQIESNVA